MDRSSYILICIPCLLVGGTEMQTLRLVEALAQGGYQVVVCCYFEYHFNVVQQFKAAGANVVCLSAYGKRPDCQRKIRRFLRNGLKRVVEEYHPRVAHVQYMAPGALPLLYLHRLKVPTLLATLHTSADIYTSLRPIHFLQRHWVRAFTCVTLAAEKGFFGNSKLYAPQSPLDKHNHFTIYNCLGKTVEVSAENASANTAHMQGKAHGTSLTHPVIGTVLRLENIKGADLVIPAFHIVRKTLAEARLIIVGDGKLRDTMQQQQRDLNLPADSIIWTGRITPNQLPEQYAQMDIAWVPSRSEGFGLSAVEAMALGVPVVTSNIGGLSEIITDGKDGMLVPAENVGALAERTISLLQDASLLQKVALAGCQRAQDFTFEKYKANILSLYSKL